VKELKSKRVEAIVYIGRRYKAVGWWNRGVLYWIPAFAGIILYVNKL